MYLRRRPLPAGAFLVVSVLSMVLQGGCSDEYDGPNYVITGSIRNNSSVPSPPGAGFSIKESVGGAAVSGATVMVNGITCDSSYVLSPFLAPPPGDDIIVEVVLGEFYAIGVVAMPEQPVITAPTGSHDASAPITVEWSTSFVPDSVWLNIDPSYTVSPWGWDVFLDGAQTSCIIPAGTLKPGTSNIRIAINTKNEITDLGPDAGAGSLIQVTDYVLGPMFSTQ